MEIDWAVSQCFSFSHCRLQPIKRRLKIAKEAFQIGHLPLFCQEMYSFQKPRGTSQAATASIVENSSEAIIVPRGRSFDATSQDLGIDMASLSESIADHSMSLVVSASERSRLSFLNVKIIGIVNGFEERNLSIVQSMGPTMWLLSRSGSRQTFNR